MIPNKFSYSSLSLYEACPYCWYLKYECGIKQKMISHNLIIGKAVHEYLEHEGKSVDVDKIIENNLPKPEFIKGKTVAQITAEVKKLVKLAEDNPLAIEVVNRELEVMMPFRVNNTDCTIHMFLDGTTKDDKILERKTSSIKYTVDTIHDSHQGRIYTLGFQYIKGIMPKGIIYDILYKAKVGRRELIDTEFTAYELQVTKDWMSGLIERILAKQFTPNKRIGYPHKNWCEYKNLCSYCK